MQNYMGRCEYVIGAVDGKAVNGQSELGDGAWSSILGDEPPQSDKGMTARLTWLIEPVLFPNKSGNTIHSKQTQFVVDLEDCGKLSWGSAVLANLYREMYKSVDIKVTEMSGCVLLLQAWAFTRMPIISPVAPLHAPYPYARR